MGGGPGRITGAGLIILAPGATALAALGWVWPPLLFALVVWMTVHSRRQPSSRLQPWLLDTRPSPTPPAPARLGGVP